MDRIAEIRTRREKAFWKNRWVLANAQHLLPQAVECMAFEDVLVESPFHLDVSP